MALGTILLAVALVGSAAGDATLAKTQSLARASNDLAFDLLRFYGDQKNVFFSPYSISTALGMVYLGSDGATAQTMRSVLKYEQNGLSEQEVLDSFQSLRSRLTSGANGYELSSFNDLLVQDYFIVLHIYAHALRLYFSSEIESVDFVRNGTAVQNRINALVESATRGKIRNFLSSPPDAATKLFILNAVHFIGNWKSPFSPEVTRDAVFFNDGVTETLVSTMVQDGVFQYAASEDLDAAAVVLPYQGNDSASMVVLLPNQRTGVEALARKVNQTVLDGLLASARGRRLMLAMPKFNASYSPDLVPALRQLGLGQLFGDAADLSRMSSQALKVSGIQHKAVIVVNEKGSEAAAATGIQIVPTSLPPVVRVNHPFLYFIRDHATGMVLFAGRVDAL